MAVVIPFENEKEAIQIGVSLWLASVWTRDVNRALRVIQISGGMVSVNSHGSASRYSTFSALEGKAVWHWQRTGHGSA